MSNKSLAIRDEIPVMELGEVLAKSGFFSDARDASQAIVKVLAGRELGFGPIASMTGFHIIKGRVTMSANLMSAAVKSHPKYDYRVTKMDDSACEIVFYENGEKLGMSSFTKQDATKAGTQNMNKFPRNMLFARAMSNGVKWYCPDVMNGQAVYTPDELDDSGSYDYDVIEQAPTVDTDTGEIIEADVEETEAPKEKSKTRKTVEARISELEKVLDETGLGRGDVSELTDGDSDEQAISIGMALAERIEKRFGELRERGIKVKLDPSAMPEYSKAHDADRLINDLDGLAAMVKFAEDENDG